ncbi:hypothetical protein CVT25_006227 [Psilocybe cyanescens]|uniref:Uncharacterized protein n=1 Tax=Psilocybe cyanescens TaxID=93625 RepID=A0A409XKL5_PSICY|nr:hypothetical protein CVT25_006227 [Psilocybe cyanescens]
MIVSVPDFGLVKQDPSIVEDSRSSMFTVVASGKAVNKLTLRRFLKHMAAMKASMRMARPPIAPPTAAPTCESLDDECEACGLSGAWEAFEFDPEYDCVTVTEDEDREVRMDEKEEDEEEEEEEEVVDDEAVQATVDGNDDDDDEDELGVEEEDDEDELETTTGLGMTLKKSRL